MTVVKGLNIPSNVGDYEDDESELSPINCSYYEVEDFTRAKFNSSKSFSILHLNIHTIQGHIEDLRTLLKLLNFHFDIFAITESKRYTTNN